MSSFQFGSFQYICEQVPLTVCSRLGSGDGIVPNCYSRNIVVFGYPIFQIFTLIFHVTALLMTTIMAVNISSKYTAVGRKEILMFFYLYIACTLLEFLLISNLVPLVGDGYTYFAAAHVGMISATCWCLLLNGFVGFQFAEDGTPRSVWSVGASSAVVFAGAYFIAVATLNSWAGFSRTSPVALWIVYFVFNGTAVVAYLALQVILVVNTLTDRWPLGGLAFGALFIILSQTFFFVVSPGICHLADRYVDGLAFGTACSLLAVMMVYKFWDSITMEDLEFSVGVGKRSPWEISNRLVDDSEEEAESDGHYPAPDLHGINRVSKAPISMYPDFGSVVCLNP